MMEKIEEMIEIRSEKSSKSYEKCRIKRKEQTKSLMRPEDL